MYLPGYPVIGVQCAFCALSKLEGKAKQFQEVINQGVCARARLLPGEDCWQMKRKEKESKSTPLSKGHD